MLKVDLALALEDLANMGLAVCEQAKTGTQHWLYLSPDEVLDKCDQHMEVVYSTGPQPKRTEKPSIFLAGPTPRRKEDVSWRDRAVELFREYGFRGALFVPEAHTKTEQVTFDYDKQVDWEDKHLNSCSCIMFWVPRSLPNFPAFTTNVEFGRFVGTRPCVYGRPSASEKNRYLDWLYTKKTSWIPHESLEETVKSAIALAGPQYLYNDLHRL
jgi:hypothetical protein